MCIRDSLIAFANPVLAVEIIAASLILYCPYKYLENRKIDFLYKKKSLILFKKIHQKYPQFWQIFFFILLDHIRIEV